MIIDAGTLDPTSAYKLLIGSILPRAIGWVSTLSKDGIANLAPISFFTAVGRKPPRLGLSSRKSHAWEPREQVLLIHRSCINRFWHEIGSFRPRLRIGTIATR